MVIKDSRVSLKAYAKINLFLEILGKREDGYHELVTVMQEIDLFDDIEILEADSGILIVCDDNDIPINNDNLIWKAARCFMDRLGIKKGVEISLKKRIPVGAGLGGGSSDAAATLKGLNQLWETGCSTNVLMEMAASIGSDVPFFINGKTGLCTGRGEIVSPISVNREYIYVIIYPNLKINTANIYQNLKLDLTKDMKDVNFFLHQLSKTNATDLGKSLYNRLELTAVGLYPDLLKLRELLGEQDFCGVQVSGSGSALFGLCERRCDAEVIGGKLNEICSAKIFVVSSVK